MKHRIDTKLERERIGQAIRERRNELRITLRQVELGTGICIDTVSRMENGKNFSIHTLIKICAYLDLKVSLVTEVKKYIIFKK